LDAIRLTEYLTQNHDGVLAILEDLGYTNLNHNIYKNEIRFSREEGRNPSSSKLDLNTLGYKIFSTNEKGNLYTLVMNRLDSKYFPDALNYIVDLLELGKSNFSNKIKYPFNGFYKNLIKELNDPELCMKTYDEDILTPFLKKYNTMFFNDGISYQTQEHFKIGYDIETNRITVPEYTFDGKLCGIMGRLNDKNCEKHERWIPIIPCSRALTLYGYHQNYKKIQEKGICVVGESEKLPMQLFDFNCYVGLATCCNNISLTQEKYIKSLLIPKTILAYDEGLEEEYIREEAKKLKIDNSIFKNEVGYIYDDDNSYLPKGSKAAPSDYGKTIFNELIKNKVRWV
jgi:DNA primase